MSKDDHRREEPPRQVPVAIDRNSPVPLYFQVSEQVARAIRTGALRPGDALENEVDLADRLGMSRPTIRRSMADLVDRGLVVRRRGVGTTVAPGALRRKGDLTSLFDDLAGSGLSPETQVLRLAHGEVDRRAAQALHLDPGTPGVAIERVRLAGGAPIAVLRNWLPLPLRDVSVLDLENDGLYTLLRRRGVAPVVAEQSIGARPATSVERRRLGLGRAEAVLTMTRIAYDAQGSPIEFGDHAYRADRHRFEVSVRVPAEEPVRQSA
jgi:GntR family transcriptional regulator